MFVSFARARMRRGAHPPARAHTYTDGARAHTPRKTRGPPRRDAPRGHRLPVIRSAADRRWTTTTSVQIATETNPGMVFRRRPTAEPLHRTGKVSRGRTRPRGNRSTDACERMWTGKDPRNAARTGGEGVGPGRSRSRGRGRGRGRGRDRDRHRGRGRDGTGTGAGIGTGTGAGPGPGPGPELGPGSGLGPGPGRCRGRSPAIYTGSS